ncbi:MBL fold metallo-hydrolase [Polaromonas eurypsychrophila]|uniref:MBL fold metallo-hydrolase n=1 Tax=Polaromonas eurypsychrophila TaxID=1614635 RepID=UPI0035713C94
MPARRIQEFGWCQSGSHAGVQLAATPSQYFSGRSLNDRHNTLWASWVIQSGDQQIFDSGDSCYFPASVKLASVSRTSPSH